MAEARLLDDPEEEREEGEERATDAAPAPTETGSTEEEKAAIAAATAHVLTNATWSGVRYAGKYLQMMEQLSHACVESFVGLTHLFDFYLYVPFRGRSARCVLPAPPRF